MPSAEHQGRVKKVTVVGAGTVGASCAWQLVKNGYQVTVIDPVDPGQSTSYGNAGCLSTSQVTPFAYPGVTRDIPGWLFDPLGPLSIRWADFPGLIPWFWRFWRSGSRKQFDWSTQAQVRLMNCALEDFDAILSDTGTSYLRKKKGAISFYDSRAEFEKELWKYELKESLGFDWQILGPAELKIMVPELDIGDGVAVFNPDWEYIIDPGQMTAEFAQASFSQGAKWIKDRVTGVSANAQGVSMQTESGNQLDSDALVVAAGAWSNQLAKQLDYTVPMTAKRGYHSMIGAPALELDYPVLAMTHHFVMTPMAEGLRVAGTAEFAKLDAEPDYARAKVLIKLARRYLPGLECKEVSEWMGQRPMMADSIPVISPSPSKENVFYAFGHGHYGLTQGPTTGKIITALVSGETPEIDIHDYRFERFKK